MTSPQRRQRDDAIWYPPPRLISTGHRVSEGLGWRPIETRKLPWRWWLAELPMRWLARSMLRDTTIANRTGLAQTGSPRWPQTETMEQHYQGGNPE
jgi:hypothetical protein